MLSILPGEVHIWHQSLLSSPERIQRLGSLLSHDEQQRANRFRREPSRQHYIMGRGGLRLILSQYLTLNPKHIQFDYGQMGKPSLKAKCPYPSIQFNLSHSGQKMLVAITCGCRVGIDVEYTPRAIEVAALSKRYFSAQEQRLLSASSPNQRTRLFLKLWTCKEALLKARGCGLQGLEDIEVLAFQKSLDNQVLFAYHPLYHNFTLRIIPTALNYVAALAVEEKDVHFVKMLSLQTEQIGQIDSVRFESPKSSEGASLEAAHLSFT